MLIRVDVIADGMTSIKKINESSENLENSFLKINFSIVFHLLSLCVFISIQNIGRASF